MGTESSPVGVDGFGEGFGLQLLVLRGQAGLGEEALAGEGDVAVEPSRRALGETRAVRAFPLTGSTSQPSREEEVVEEVDGSEGLPVVPPGRGSTPAGGRAGRRRRGRGTRGSAVR